MEATVIPYGASINDGVRINSERRYAKIPAVAPSISQGFKPGTQPEGSGGHGENEYHYAIDIIEKTGTPVLAVAPGTVVHSSYNLFYGNRIFFSHRKDTDVHYLSGYNHMEDRSVTVGARVERGQQIGTLGDSGFLSGRLPHLHFEIRKGTVMNDSPEVNVNPHKYWFDGKGIVTCFDSNKNFDTEGFKITYPVPCMEAKWRADL